MRRAVAFIPLVLAAVAACGGDDSTAPPSVSSCDVEIQDPARAPSLEPLNRSRAYRIEFRTSHGAFTVELDPTKSPCNGDSLVDLARAGFFNGTRFHRIIPDFIIQGGDPTGTGNGGSGYTTVDAPPPDTTYTKGVVAMAKSQFEPPGTGGSQFFIVTGDDAGLPPDYAAVGRIVEGMPVVERIGRLGNQQTEAPTERIVIQSTSVTVE